MCIGSQNTIWTVTKYSTFVMCWVSYWCKNWSVTAGHSLFTISSSYSNCSSCSYRSISISPLPTARYTQVYNYINFTLSANTFTSLRGCLVTYTQWTFTDFHNYIATFSGTCLACCCFSELQACNRKLSQDLAIKLMSICFPTTSYLATVSIISVIWIHLSPSFIYLPTHCFFCNYLQFVVSRK